MFTINQPLEMGIGFMGWATDPVTIQVPSPPPPPVPGA